jgi:hypothetical protein
LSYLVDDSAQADQYVRQPKLRTLAPLGIATKTLLIRSITLLKSFQIITTPRIHDFQPGIMASIKGLPPNGQLSQSKKSFLNARPSQKVPDPAENTA